MRSKEKIKSTVIRCDTRREEGYIYRYELTMKEGRSTASYGLSLYSIRVTMTDIEGKSTDGEVEDVFSDVGKAIVFYEKLVKNLATPIDLAYIAEDEWK